MALTPNGAAIRQLREESGWNLRTFAIKARVSPGYLSKIETGTSRNVSPDALSRIAEALDAPMGALTGDRVAFREALKTARRRPRPASRVTAERVA